MSGSGQQQDQQQQQRHTIAIPSAKEVREAERQRAAVPNYFRPSSEGAAPPAQQAQQQQQVVNAGPPPAFLGGPGPSAPRPPPQQPQRPPYQPPQQQQQQQHRPPSQAPQPQQYASQQQQQQQQQQPGGPPMQQQWQQQPRPAYGGAPPGGQPMQYQQQPAQQPFPPNAIIVNRRQEGNPVLKHIRNVRWVYGDIVPDYMLGRDAACLFLSLRFHMLKPEYIYGRMKELGRSFRLRIIMCHVDTEDPVEPLGQVTRAAIFNEFTLICGWSNLECARYLETFKSFENKPAEMIKKEVGNDYVSRLTAALTTIRGVNRTDVKTLGDHFGSAARIFQASMEELLACPGIGPTKARRLYETFHEPFRRQVVSTNTQATASPGQPQQQQQQQQQQGAGAASQGQQTEAGTQVAASQLPMETPLDEVELGEEEEEEEEFFL